jgi:DNA-binding CsgD family transcriptional regulator
MKEPAMPASNCFQLDPREAVAFIESLTPREREVAGFLALGESRAAIGRKLFLSVKTVDTYAGRIRDKFNDLSVARVWFCAAVYGGQHQEKGPSNGKEESPESSMPRAR